MAAATRISVAQIEFAASQKRQEATKLDEKEHDKPLKIRFCPASDAKLLIYRLTVVATLIAVFVLSERIRFSLQTITKSSIVSVRRSAFGVQRSAFSVRRSAFGVQRSAFDGRGSFAVPPFGDRRSKPERKEENSATFLLFSRMRRQNRSRRHQCRSRTPQPRIHPAAGFAAERTWPPACCRLLTLPVPIRTIGRQKLAITLPLSF